MARRAGRRARCTAYARTAPDWSDAPACRPRLGRSPAGQERRWQFVGACEWPVGAPLPKMAPRTDRIKRGRVHVLALAGAAYSTVVPRLDRGPSIPEAVVIDREAAAYWVPRLRGGRQRVSSEFARVALVGAANSTVV